MWLIIYILYHLRFGNNDWFIAILKMTPSPVATHTVVLSLEVAPRLAPLGAEISCSAARFISINLTPEFFNFCTNTFLRSVKIVFVYVGICFAKQNLFRKFFDSCAK